MMTKWWDVNDGLNAATAEAGYQHRWTSVGKWKRQEKVAAIWDVSLVTCATVVSIHVQLALPKVCALRAWPSTAGSRACDVSAANLK